MAEMNYAKVLQSVSTLISALPDKYTIELEKRYIDLIQKSARLQYARASLKVQSCWIASNIYRLSTHRLLCVRKKVSFLRLRFFIRSPHAQQKEFGTPMCLENPNHASPPKHANYSRM